MAEITTDQVMEWMKNLDPERMKKFFDTITQSSPAVNQTLTKLFKTLDDGKDAIVDLGTSAEDAFKKLKSISLTNIIDDVQNLTRSHKDWVSVGQQAALVGGALYSGLKPEIFDSMSRSVESNTYSLEGTVKSLAAVGAKVPLAGEALKEFGKIAPFAEMADSARKFELGLIQTAAASGDLGELYKTVGDDLAGLALKQQQYIDISFQAAQANNLTTKQASEYARALMSIPGAMDTTITSTENGIKDMSLLDAALKVAAGTGQNFADVQEQINDAFLSFGTPLEKSLNYISRMSDVSQNLRIPLNLVHQATKTAADSFKLFGDNSEAAIEIMNRMGGALKQTGLGPQAITQVIQDMTQAIGQMGIAQKAFLSQQTGGANGLQGAFQVDLLLRQGKLDEVQKKVEQSLKQQFGGRIVGLEEAAGNSQAAGQYAKQLQLLTQGPTKIANSEAEAERIIEAMIKGNKQTALKSPEESLKGALSKGEAIEERQDNKLLKIQNILEKEAQLSAISAYNFTRLVAGSENISLATSLRKSRQGASDILANIKDKFITGTGVEGGKTASESAKELFGKLSGMASHVTGVGNKILDKERQKLLEKNSKPITPSQNVQRILSTPKENIPTTAKIEPTRNGEKLEIHVAATCPQCNKKVAEETAFKIGKQLIEQNESNKNIAIHVGANHGL